jgi:glycerol dehydrogenase-like iron-containing ADH family enzyme
MAYQPGRPSGFVDELDQRCEVLVERVVDEGIAVEQVDHRRVAAGNEHGV